MLIFNFGPDNQTLQNIQIGRTFFSQLGHIQKTIAGHIGITLTMFDSFYQQTISVLNLDIFPIVPLWTFCKGKQ